MDVVRLLEQLVRIPSINPMGRAVDGPPFLEERLTDFLEDLLRAEDLRVERRRVLPGRDNLLATYVGPGPGPHVMLEVHQDTVPVEGMTIDPFAAMREGDRLYGRGACDNKGPMAAMIAAIVRLARERPKGSATVTLALTVDEEHTFLGIQEIAANGPFVDAAIVAEPTELIPVIAHKGTVRWEVHAHGRACHSSRPKDGVNAIYRMASVLLSLEKYAEDLAHRPADPLLGPPSLSVGVIAGGICVNIVPDHCHIEVDRRLIPGEEPLAAHAEVVQLLADDAAIAAEVVCSPPFLHLSPLDTAINGPLAEALMAVLRERGRQPQPIGVSYGTDASSLNRAGIPSIVFGPGSIDQAHTKDEWVSVSQVVEGAELYFDFCRTASARLPRRDRPAPSPSASLSRSDHP